MATQNDNFLDGALSELQIASASFAQKFIPDAKTRMDYISETAKFSKSLKEKLARNHITPQMAAQEAQMMRNTIMDAMRGKTSSLGLSIARYIKNEGKSLGALESKYADQLFKLGFEQLNN